MKSRFAIRAQTVLRLHKRPSTCLHRGETIRREKKSCCGTVEIFQCSKRQREVWHTKCRTCEFFVTQQLGEENDPKCFREDRRYGSKM